MQKVYLADTQILIWALIDPYKLSPEILRILATSTIYVSQISLFEIAIKQSIGKLPDLPVSIGELESVLLNDGFKISPITTAHIASYSSIPLLTNHRDPFDRLILATAYAEKWHVISADENFPFYEDLIDLVKCS